MNFEGQFYKTMFFIGAPIVVILLIVFFIGIGFFIAKQTVQEDCSKCDKNKNKNKKIKIVTKKDMAYWFIILSIFVIFWLSSYLYQDAVLVEYISFSGTIISIVLAIVAIIFSYFQNFSSSHTTDSLIKVSEDLLESLENLDEYNNNITSSNNTIENILKKLDNLSGSLNDSITLITSVGKDIKDVKDNVTPVNTTTSSKNNVSSNWTDYKNSNIFSYDSNIDIKYDNDNK